MSIAFDSIRPTTEGRFTCAHFCSALVLLLLLIVQWHWQMSKKIYSSTILILFCWYEIRSESVQTKERNSNKSTVPNWRLAARQRSKNFKLRRIAPDVNYDVDDDDTRMVRTDKTLSNNGSKKPSNSSDCDNEYVTSESDATPTTETRESVHKQNLYIVSFPIILLFNILRSILYQFFIVFKYIFNVSSHFLHHPLRKRNKNTSENCVSHSNASEALLTTERRTAVPNVMPLPIVSQQSTGPGPGDPMLAKQKHHHRRAFEYISKALKIDEENEGKHIKGIFIWRL